jgi:hypothetical protein
MPGAAGLTSYRSLPLEEALVCAEDEAMERGGAGTKTLTKRKARWRKDAVEQDGPQMRMGKGLGVYREGMSKGELSEAIDSVMAARRIDPLVRVVRANLNGAKA